MKNKQKTIHASIEVWNLLLPELRDELTACRELLTDRELERAAKFFKADDADRFILCRGLRRRVLADYLDESPAALLFDHNENGKPFLRDSEICFNVSHSRDRLLIAVTVGRAVGVDIEFRRDGVPMESIAKRWFAPEERAFFQGLENPRDGFFDIWAKKEAFVKALGQGIFHELNSFCVPLDHTPGVPRIGKNGDWFFQPLKIDPAYAAAIVSEAPPVPVHLRNDLS